MFQCLLGFPRLPGLSPRGTGGKMFSAFRAALSLAVLFAVFSSGFAGAAGDVFNCSSLTPGGRARPGPYFQSVYHSYEVLDKELVRDYQRDACEYLTDDIGLIVEVEFYKNESDLDGYLAVLRMPGGWESSGSNWRMNHSTIKFVTQYDDIGNPKFDFYVYKPSARFAEKTGNCLVRIILDGGASGFSARYNWEAIPGRGPFASKQEAQQAGQNYVMSDVVQRGEAIIANRQLAEFCTLSEGGSATASPSPTPSATPKPSATPSPTPTPEPVCEASGEIVFEPTQGVWQDDYNFSPAPGRQIVRTALGRYRAELPMVKGRQSLIFGLKGVAALDAASDNDRKIIKVRANVTGTRSVFSRIRFTLSQGGSEKRVYDTAPIVDLPLLPPCGPVRAFEFDYPNELGMPQSAPFTFDSAGAYELKAEVVRAENGKGTGVETVVSGNVVETFAPRAYFVPITIEKSMPAAQQRAMHAWTLNLGRAARDYIPDYYPLEQGRKTLPVLIYPQVKSYYSLMREVNDSWKVWWNALSDGDRTMEETYRDYRKWSLLATLMNEIGTGARLGSADRIIAVMNGSEMLSLYNVSAAGYAITPKVLLVTYNPLLASAPHDTVAHEFAHTLPYIWSDPQMIADCGKNYHNDGNRTAHGFRITYGGAPAARMHVQPGGALSIMGPERAVIYDAANYTIWNDQCTYANLANVLQARPDPKLLLVRGLLARGNGRHAAILSPAYEFEGALPENGTGSWWLLAKDGHGGVLGKYFFEPEWLFETENGIIERNVVAFSQAVLFDEKARSMELYSPDGLEQILVISVDAPVVKIITPANGSSVEPADGKVNVSWIATDADSESLEYTVLYSSDGENWQAQAFETAEASAEIILDDAPNHFVKVIATDGGRSGEAIVSFDTRAGQGQAANWELLLNGPIDLSFLPAELVKFLGNGFASLEISDGSELHELWFSVENGTMIEQAGADGANESILAIAMNRSIFESVSYSVDPENAAKLALKNGAAQVVLADALTQLAFEGAKRALDAKEFSPAPDTALEFHGKPATVIAGPGGRPALSIPNERYLPVMNEYGAPLGATTRQAIAQAEKSSLGFSKGAGVIAADPATGRPLIETISPRLAPFISTGSSETAAKAAYYGALGAKKAYENASKKT